MQVCKFASLQICNYESMQVHKYARMKRGMYTSLQVWKEVNIYASMQVFKYTSIQVKSMHLFKHKNILQVCRYPNFSEYVVGLENSEIKNSD